MGVVRGSVTVSTPNPGNYQVTMPEADLDVIGIAPWSDNGLSYQAPPLVGIYIDASNIAYLPLPPTAYYTVRKYSPVHVKLRGTVLNLYIPYIAPNNSASGLTIYYGDPEGNEIEFSLLKGVAFSQENTSTTSPLSGTIPITFPSGNVKITGIFAIGVEVFGQLSFVTGTGKSLIIPISDSPDPMDLPDNIIPLDLESATTLSINFAMTNNTQGNATIYGVIYYQ